MTENEQQYYDDLDDWAFRTMQALQDIVDEAQLAAGDPDGESECRDIRALMAEYEAIRRGEQTWQFRLADDDSHDDNPIAAL